MLDNKKNIYDVATNKFLGTYFNSKLLSVQPK